METDVQGRFEEAIEDYTRAVALNPRHCRAFYNRAFSYDRLQQFEAAIADYSRALEIEPTNATAFHNRASLLERSGRCVMWYRHFKIAIQNSQVKAPKRPP